MGVMGFVHNTYFQYLRSREIEGNGLWGRALRGSFRFKLRDTFFTLSAPVLQKHTFGLFDDLFLRPLWRGFLYNLFPRTVNQSVIVKLAWAPFLLGFGLVDVATKLLSVVAAGVLTSICAPFIGMFHLFSSHKAAPLKAKVIRIRGQIFQQDITETAYYRQRDREKEWASDNGFGVPHYFSLPSSAESVSESMMGYGDIYGRLWGAQFSRQEKIISPLNNFNDVGCVAHQGPEEGKVLINAGVGITERGAERQVACHDHGYYCSEREPRSIKRFLFRAAIDKSEESALRKLGMMFVPDERARLCR